jgi:hypothetical protein
MVRAALKSVGGDEELTVNVFVVPAGGLSADRSRWIKPRYAFFLPVKVLRRVFRGKFLAGLRTLGVQGKLALPELGPWYAKDWVVYAKPPFGGPEQVLKYLARYTHRVAISNHRLVKFEAGRVTFRYHDYADSRKEKLLTLSAEEFLRRFVQHVLPKGFMKIRHYGLLSSQHREARLHQARSHDRLSDHEYHAAAIRPETKTNGSVLNSYRPVSGFSRKKALSYRP